MRIFYSPKEKLRDSHFEIHNGKIVEPFECPDRMAFILETLKARGWSTEEPENYDLSMAHKVHRADYLEFLASAYDEWRAQGNNSEAVTYIWPAQTMRQDVIPECVEAKIGYYCLSSDTSITDGTWEAALSAKDCAEAAAQAVIDGERAAFALCRPPGHHAAHYQFGGYCFLNNAAIAAERLLAHGAKKISILDVDFHHGNGTQDIFYSRKDVQFVSIHGDPSYCFPYFLGYENERGEGEGLGYNFNIPLSKGTRYPKWKTALERAMAQIHEYAPDAIVISLGVDTFKDDPISHFKLNTSDFADYSRLLHQMDLPTVFVMEGGYAIGAIGNNVANVIEGFAKAQNPSPSSQTALKNI